MMNNKDKINMFLKHLADNCVNNSDVSFSDIVVYRELSKFAVSADNKQYNIDNKSLLSVQLGLNIKYKFNNKVTVFSDGYFWVIENRCKKNDDEFYSEVDNGVKLYVAVSPDNIYNISKALFDFMIKENIIMQSKIAKEMRNDVLVCRLTNCHDAKKVSDFLNNLDYKSDIKPNPFLVNDGKVCYALDDGDVSYNEILSQLIAQYLMIKKFSNCLDEISCEDFNNFIKKEIEMFNGEHKYKYMRSYHIENEEMYKNFIVISNLISKNMENGLTLEQLFKYREIKDIDVLTKPKIVTSDDEDKILYVINYLSSYYSINEVHEIIMKYINDGDVRVFTRKNNIRAIISENYTSDDVKNIISNLGYSALVSAFKATYQKYGVLHMSYALEDIINGEGIQGFTNDNDVRSRLGLIIPPELLKEVIEKKIKENDMVLDSRSLFILLANEIENNENKKSYGRK